MSTETTCAGQGCGNCTVCALRADLDSATVLYAQVSGELAALRRRVGEAARKRPLKYGALASDSSREVVSKLMTFIGQDYQRSNEHMVEEMAVLIDRERAAAGELRGVLREAVDLIATKAVNVATVDVGRLQAFTKRPDVLAATKELT
jgi:hypothetical protein